MKFNFTPLLIIVILITSSLPMEGKRVAMIPLTARDVYRVLRAAGREDAVPEGRVVTQGIAAVSGFALGLAKGIGGSLLFDVAVASGLFGGANQNQPVQTQEVCFSSRSLNEIYDGEDEDVAQGRQAGTTTTPTTTTGTTPTTTTPKAATNSPTTQATNPTNTITMSPTTTDTNNGDGTYVDNGDDTGTQTDTTTQTGTGGAVNCVVIQQPPSSTPQMAG